MAEMLFNLQHEAWFPLMVSRLVTNDEEACFSELEIATLLKNCGVKFALNAPQQKANTDFDFVIYKEEGIIAAEVECKVESTAVSKNGILTRLRRARRQLPPDQPGAIFMRVPEAWMPHTRDDSFIEEVVDEFFLETSRVISVVVFTTYFDHSDQLLSNRVNVVERVNPRQEFGANLIPLITMPIASPTNHLNFSTFFQSHR